jgi:hypothetical protein
MLVSRALSASALAAVIAAAGVTTAVADEADPVVPTIGITEAGIITLPDGDGVRDSTTVTVTSDAPTTVSLSITDTSWTEVETLPSVELTAEELTSDVTVPVTGLPAGNYYLVATPEGGDAVSTDLMVGSGEPSSVFTDLSTYTIFSLASATPHSTAVTVYAWDETGEAVPFQGTVTATVGGKTTSASVQSTDGSNAVATISGTALGAGTGPVVATVHAFGSSVNYSSDPLDLDVVSHAVTGLSLARTASSVYPYKDYYRDTVTFTVKPSTSTGSNFGATGTVKITRLGKTVKTWTLTSTGSKTLTWDGKVGGKIVTGTYTVTASIKGPEGSTKTASTTVKVDSGKLVSKTKTINYKASSVFSRYIPFDNYGDNACYINYPHLGYSYCYAPYAAYADTYALIGTGAVTIPSYVQSAEQYGGAKVNATLYSVSKTGSIEWALFGDYGSTRSGYLKSGTNSLGTVTLATGSKKTYLYVGLDRGEKVSSSSVKVIYTYRVMTH